MVSGMGGISIGKESCTGCGACRSICPKGAISMAADEEGFCYPSVNEGKCVRCGKCISVCPAMGDGQNGDFNRICRENQKDGEKGAGHSPEVYAAWSMNPKIRYESTSGGIFSELALAVLEDGGYICGAAYADGHMVKHCIANTKEGLDKLRQSKYVQSDMGGSYDEICGILQQGKALLFCGTPCQCEGVLKFCKEKKTDISSLYLVDFICRGISSPKVYRKYLGEMETRYGSAIKRVWFKNKTYGWNYFCTKLEFENGESYLQDRFHDAYVRGYIEENLYLRLSCGKCKFKGFRRSADITLADFWGVKVQGAGNGGGDISEQGISMVMPHTRKGKSLWDRIMPHVYWEEKRLQDVQLGNICFEHSIRHGEYRGKFMEDLDKMPVIENIERFLRNGL